MTSASVELASSQYSDPFFFLKRQLIFSAVGMLVLVGYSSYSSGNELACAWSWYLLMGSFALLLLVLVPGVGESVKGSTRRIDLVCLRTSAIGAGEGFYRGLSRSIFREAAGRSS